MKTPRKHSRAAKQKSPSGTRQPKRGDAYQKAVAAVARSLDPSAVVDVGVWTEGPDGRRDLDVRIRQNRDDVSRLVVIECKDWDRPIGIAFIDALDSKRRDIDASVAMICSNSGFTADALRKAARVGIPALSAMIEGDHRIRVVVREQIYTPVVTYLRHGPIFHHPDLSDETKALLAEPLYTNEWTYGGKSLEAWVAGKLLEIASFASASRSFSARYVFREPITFDIRGAGIAVSAIDIRGAFTVQWMTQVAEIGASQGMYDYLRKILIFGPGPYSFQLKNVNAVTWGAPVQIEDVPPRLLVPPGQHPKPELGSTSKELRLRMLKNMPPSDPKDAPDIDQFIIGHEIIDEDDVSTG